LLTLLGNIFPPEQEQPADTTLHQALLAATALTAQALRRSERDQSAEPVNNRNGKLKRKQDREQGEWDPWDRVFSALKYVKSEISCFRKVLVEAGLMQEDLPCRHKQQAAADKENARDPKSKTQRPDKFAGAASKGKGKTKAKAGPAPSYLPVLQVDYRVMNVHCRRETRKGD
jgi:hypothetical protein